MVFGFFVEFVWTAPLAILLAAFLYLLKRYRGQYRSLVAWTLSFLLAVAYAFALSFWGGPAVGNLPLPVLPFLFTLAACTVWLIGWRQHWLLPLGIVAMVWMATLTASHLIAGRDACRLVFIQRTALSSPVRWSPGANPDVLISDEHIRVDQAHIGAGVLEPIQSLEWGSHPHRTVIFVMYRDVTQPLALPVPEKGTAIYIQQTDGTWQTDVAGATMGENKVQLTPAKNATTFQVTGVYGTSGTEVSFQER